MKPRRTVLSVPGHILKMHEKAAGSGSDVIMLDLEDSVPMDVKEKARKQVIESLLAVDWNVKTMTVRINGLDTPFGYQDLLAVAENTGHLLDAVVIPKVDHCGDVYFADRMLNGIEMQKKIRERIGIEAIIESAEGMENISEIAGASRRLKTLVFGVADYSASIGARLASISGHGEKEDDLYPGHRWNFAVSRMVTAAKANHLMAIDSPYGNFKDTEGLKKSALSACALGCNGKWAIHPDQIATINRVFTPSTEDIERARRVIQAFESAKKEGRGAAAVEGRMIDQATYRLARQLREEADFLGLV